MPRYGFEAYSKFAKAFKKAFGVDATIERCNVTDDLFDLKARFLFEKATDQPEHIATRESFQWVTDVMNVVTSSVNLYPSVNIKVRYSEGVVYGDCTFSVCSEVGNWQIGTPNG